MPLITFEPSGKTIHADPGTLLSDAARAAGVFLEFPCGGKGVCGRCLLQIIAGTVAGETPDSDTSPVSGRLAPACRTHVADTPLTLKTPEQASPEDGQFSRYAEDLRAVEAALMPQGCPTPTVRQVSLTVSPPGPDDGLSDLDRLNRTVNAVLGGAPAWPLDLLTNLPAVLRESDGAVCLRYWTQGETPYAVSLTATPCADYGLAVDIGTTTVAAHLVSLDTGAILASQTDYNAQIDCGLDIISRIHYARDAERLDELRERVLGTINALVAQITDTRHVSPTDIVDVALAGNTTMIHLFLGIVPEYIRLSPYTPAVFAPPIYPARDLGLRVHPNAPVHIAPAVGSYVGGDITAGLLCTRLSCGEEPGPDTASSGPMMLIDLGTNGEIVLGDEDFLLGCACSAGPAFEGGGLRHGCRAHTGAIERVDLDAENGLAVCSTIGGTPPTGLCGSGAISLLAELFRKGFLDAAGHYTDRAPLITESGRRCFPVVPAGDGRQAITFSETDIDNLMRAKAAVFSACQTLLDSVGLTFDDLTRVYVAGGFGRFLSMDDAATIGLLPRLNRDGQDARMAFLGNASLTGAYMTLVSETHRKRLRDTARRITYIDLSAQPGYMDAYMAALFLPHTSLPFD